MPIVIDRNTGEVTSRQELTQGQRQTAWEMIVKAYIKNNPDSISDKKESS